MQAWVKAKVVLLLAVLGQDQEADLNLILLRQNRGNLVKGIENKTIRR